MKLQVENRTERHFHEFPDTIPCYYIQPRIKFFTKGQKCSKKETKQTTVRHSTQSTTLQLQEIAKLVLYLLEKFYLG